ncbi:hypothetical protein IT414_03420 [bacterium]|nr:hypothetical protein [bacterium]
MERHIDVKNRQMQAIAHRRANGVGVSRRLHGRQTGVLLVLQREVSQVELMAPLTEQRNRLTRGIIHDNLTVPAVGHRIVQGRTVLFSIKQQAAASKTKIRLAAYQIT